MCEICLLFSVLLCCFLLAVPKPSVLHDTQTYLHYACATIRASLGNPSSRKIIIIQSLETEGTILLRKANIKNTVKQARLTCF
jgi:hypothetical protein